MGSAVERLLGMVDAQDCYTIPWKDLLPLQIEAANERLSSRKDAIRLLAHRAAEGGIDAIRTPADLVPLLFAHTTYKSYPESWLIEGKWDKLGRWLDTVSTFRVQNVDTRNVRDIDDWLERLAAVGHFLSCSSGTTGKCSMINASMADRTLTKRLTVAAFQWATGVRADRDRRLFSVHPAGNNFRNNDTIASLAEAFAAPGAVHPFPHEPITVGQVSRMVTLRRSIADGTARPGELAAFEATAAAREKAMEEAITAVAEALVAHRAEKLIFNGPFALMFRVSEAVRALGHGGSDFHPENAWLTGGGLKGAALPSDFRERILSTFNIRPENFYELYSMQEINTHMPRCRAGRYHVAPWLMLLVLDRDGEQLIEPNGGEIEGRAAFFDLSIEGRWGGVISGDRIRADYGRCACGHEGPTISSDIVRYADLEGGDKISCAGTIDAYIRGAT